MVNALRVWSNLRQAVIVVTLFTVFFYFFGLSTLEKWERKDVQIVTRRVPGQTLRLPAISVCGTEADHQRWKNSKHSGFDKCRKQTDMFQCVRDNTYSVEEVILKSLLIIRTRESDEKTTEQLNNTLWTSSMTKTAMGMCHTMVYEKDINSVSEIRISLKKGLKRTFLLHDPKFFTYINNNVFIPFLKLDASIMRRFKISATNIKKMNRPKIFDCNTDPSYNFRECVRQKKSNREGCVSPFDRKTTDTLPLCSNMSSLDSFALFYHMAYYSSSRSELEDLTGCHVPCSYAQYDLVSSEPMTSAERSDVFKLRYQIDKPVRLTIRFLWSSFVCQIRS